LEKDTQLDTGKKQNGSDVKYKRFPSQNTLSFRGLCIRVEFDGRLRLYVFYTPFLVFSLIQWPLQRIIV
jgi:hypothetical protein